MKTNFIGVTVKDKTLLMEPTDPPENEENKEIRTHQLEEQRNQL